MNMVILKGNAGGDPELRYTPTGKAVAAVSLATNRRWTGPDGEKKQETDWHKLEVWGKLAEVIAEHVKKGQEILVTGRIKYDVYQPEGSQEKKYFTKIVVNEFEFCGRREAGGADSEPEDEGISFGE